MNLNKFFTLLMGECWHDYYWIDDDGKHAGGHWECKSCRHKTQFADGWKKNPDHLSNPLPVIRFMEKEMPGVLNDYLQTLSYTKWREDETGYLCIAVLNTQLDLSNLADYLKEHREWGWVSAYPHCVRLRSIKANCDCHGTGIIKHPALEYLEASHD